MISDLRRKYLIGVEFIRDFSIFLRHLFAKFLMLI